MGRGADPGMTASTVVPAAPGRSGPASTRDLFWSFTVLALQGFGGVVAVVQRELVERKQWLTREEFVEDWAVAQILPGPNVINLSLMLGDRYFGLRGSLAAMAGLTVFPLAIVVVLAIVFSGLSDMPAAQGAMRGMGAAVAGLIAATGLRLLGALRQNVMGMVACGLFCVATFVAIALLRLPLAGVLLGLGGVASLWAWHRLGQQTAHPPETHG
jgi:chromate transporter